MYVIAPILKPLAGTAADPKLIGAEFAQPVSVLVNSAPQLNFINSAIDKRIVFWRALLVISKRTTQNVLKMSDVAAELGLSRVAVSAVINGRARKAGLPERTEQRVLEYLKKRGYVPSRNACHLRSAPDCVIGIMHVGSIYSHLTEAFHRLVKTLGSGAHGLEIVMTPRERIEETVREVAARRVTHLV